MFKDNGSNWRKWDLHVHTASSYDYGYKAKNCNEELVKAWDEQGYAAVAITDHFLIDAERIKELRELSNNKITIFPGVELRTDKGSSNIHVILIFNEICNLQTLSSDFESRMLRNKAKPKEYTNDNVYWDYADILEFAKEYDAIISIHSGNKTNGIDKCMANALPQNMAIKTEYAETVDIYEVSSLEDIRGYKQNVFKK